MSSADRGELLRLGNNRCGMLVPITKFPVG